jgi:hypothetical protein
MYNYSWVLSFQSCIPHSVDVGVKASEAEYAKLVRKSPINLQQYLRCETGRGLTMRVDS